MRIGSASAIALLSLVSIAHLLRVAFRVAVTAGGVDVPVWVSVLGCLVPGTIAVMLWCERPRFGIGKNR